MATCYRHPGRETGVSCSNCGRPICTDCMTATSVGMRCPECAKQKTRVHTARTMTTDPIATYVLIAINVLAAIGSGSLFGGGGRSQAFIDGALIGIGADRGGLIGVAEGEYWRLITGGFLHSGILHLAFNMYVLYWLGTMLEPSIGRVRFLGLYFSSMLAGAFGALLLEPTSLTVGASGAVFGLMGAAFVMQRARGINPMQSGLGPVILLNLGLSFVISNISIGGHVGGLIGGGLAAYAMDQASARSRSEVLALAGCIVVGVVSVVGSIVTSDAEKQSLIDAAARLLG